MVMKITHFDSQLMRVEPDTFSVIVPTPRNLPAAFKITKKTFTFTLRADALELKLLKKV